MANPDQALWERNLARYRVAAAMVQAEWSFGPSFTEEEKLRTVRGIAEHRFGSNARAMADDESRTEILAAVRRVEAANDAAYYTCVVPHFDAGVALIRTPAPNLEAVLTKIAIANEDRLHSVANEDAFPREELFAIIQSELRTFGAEVGL